MKMVYGRKGEEKALDIKPALPLFGSKKFREASFKIDLSEEVIVFRRIRDFDPSQIRYLCEQIVQRMNELGFLVEKTSDQIFEKMERGDCPVLSSRMEALFFACFYEVAGVYVIDNLLIHNTCAEIMKGPFREFLSFKTGQSGIGRFFGFAPREVKSEPQTLYSVFLATSGFDLWDPLTEEHRDLLKLLQTHENLGDLLEEAYWIFYHEAGA